MCCSAFKCAKKLFVHNELTYSAVSERDAETGGHVTANEKNVDAKMFLWSTWRRVCS